MSDELGGTFQNDALFGASGQGNPPSPPGPQQPACPHCGAPIPTEVIVCAHCQGNISWVDDVPCEPGTEDELLARIKEHALAKTMWSALVLSVSQELEGERRRRQFKWMLMLSAALLLVGLVVYTVVALVV